MYLQLFFERLIYNLAVMLYMQALKALPTNSETLAFVLTYYISGFTHRVSSVKNVEKNQYKVQQLIFLPSLTFIFTSTNCSSSKTICFSPQNFDFSSSLFVHRKPNDRIFQIF